jgi:aminoglycoside phosphotransferase (APT) family kinase protein
MRENIFYWKCDNALTAEDQKRLYLQSKYDSDMERIAHDIATDFFHSAPDALQALGVEGNHFVYLVEKAGQKAILRTDDGRTQDDYLGVESRVMELARKNGIPVPELYGTDVSLTRFPVRFQLMEFVEAPSLATLAQQHAIDRHKIALECGRILGRLHSIPIPGYGFFRTGAELRGIDSSPAAYFNKRLEDHLAYLETHRLLDTERARMLISRALPLLDDIPGVLLHRDFAFWNLLGTPERILAVIDWDDAVSGDPADDFGIIHCFHEQPFLDTALAAYAEIHPVGEAFRARVALHTLRNMLWKTVMRHRLGYFRLGEDFFLSRNELGLPMKEYTLRKLSAAMTELEGMS